MNIICFDFDFVGFVLILQEVLVVVTPYTHFYCCVNKDFCEENCGFSLVMNFKCEVWSIGQLRSPFRSCLVSHLILIVTYLVKLVNSFP